MPAKLHANMPPNDPMSDRTPGVNVSRANWRMRFLAALDESISTPASLYVMPILPARGGKVRNLVQHRLNPLESAYGFRQSYFRHVLLFLQARFPQVELTIFSLRVAHHIDEIDRVLAGVARVTELAALAADRFDQAGQAQVRQRIGLDVLRDFFDGVAGGDQFLLRRR